VYGWYRDVKTQNFLVDDSFVVKVIDFGVSRVIDNEQQMTLIGTPGKKEYCLLSLILIQRLIFDFTKT
jgi:hypothetical protein